MIPAAAHAVDTDCTSLVSAPATVRDLIRIKTRSKLGNLELAMKGFTKPAAAEKSPFKIMPSLAELVVYGTVNLFALKAAQRQLKTIDSYVWEKDESSRQTSL